MADYFQSIEDMYNKLKQAKKTSLENDTQQKLAGLDSQQQALANQYQELQNTLNARKQATQGQYQTLYTGLDNQLNQGKDQYYQDRNSAALNNAQNTQKIRDYMARNNLMSSGENVDAMLRGNTDYNNNLGNIYSNEQQFTRGIGDKRNQYSLEEQNAYNDINNQLGAADREKAQKIADILNQRNLLNTSMLSELQAYQDQLDAQKVKDVADYNERLRQEAAARAQQAAAARASAAKASASSATKSAAAQKQKDTDAVWNELYANIDQRSGEQFLQQNRSAIISNLGSKVYKDMLDYVQNYKYSAAENQRYGRNMKDATPQNYYRDMG